MISPCLDSLKWAHSTSLIGTKKRICIGILKVTNISKEWEFVPFNMEGRNVMLCSLSPTEILKQHRLQAAVLCWRLGDKEARLSPPLLAMLPWEIQLPALCSSVFWPSLIKMTEIPRKNALCWVLPLSTWGNYSLVSNTGVHTGWAQQLRFPTCVSSPGHPPQAA